MDTWKNKIRDTGKISFKTKGLIQKTVASFVTVFFIFYGIPMPTSFAAIPELTQNEQNQTVPVIKYDPAIADTSAAHDAIPTVVSRWPASLR